MSLLHLMKRVSLRTKFAVPISVMITVLVMAISGYLIKRQADGFRREFEISGETMIRMLAMNVESGVLFESKYELDEALNILSQFEAVEYASITNSEGEILAEIGQWNDDNVVRSALDRDWHLEGALHSDYYVQDQSGTEHIELNYPVLSRTENLNREVLGMTGGLDNSVAPAYVTEEIGAVRLILSLRSVEESIAEARTTVILLTVVVLVIALIILASLVRFITRPVKKLVEATDRISRGDLTLKMDIDQHDEIGQLAQTFDKMVESLKQSRDEIEEYNRTLESKIVERTLELEEAQAQLIQSEKLSAIGQLAAGVAHELNNPLGGILGYAQFTLEKMKKSVSDGITSKEINNYLRYLTDIEAQARRCKNIVQNLLRFSRSSRTIDFSDVSINQVIEDTCTFVEHQLKMNQIQLKKELDDKVPVVQGNAGQLQQVFTNLVINAMHASPAESEIKILSRFSPALGEFGGAVEIACVDQGTGISPENIKKIFEPFFSTKEVGKGTGLGLAVSYGIIKEHGGEIKVDSTPGGGTTFTIILPVQKPPSKSDTSDKGYVADLTRKPSV